jgi:hypothetical protein
MALQRQSVFINKVRIALQNFTVVALIESLAHMSLLVNDAVGMVKDVGERRTKKAGVVAVEGFWLNSIIRLTAWRRAFDGMVPQWVQPPPTLW